MIDLKIIQEFLGGSTEAFEQIVLEYKNCLISFIYRYINDLDNYNSIYETKPAIRSGGFNI